MGKWESGDLGSVPRSGTAFPCVLGQFAYIKIFKYCKGNRKSTTGLASRAKPLRTMYFFQKHLWHIVLYTKLGSQSAELQN